MLLKKEKSAQIDPLENWPEHYYEIENAKERKEIPPVFLPRLIA